MLPAAAAQAITPFGRRAEAAAKRDAGNELAAVRLPPSAHKLKRDDSVNAVLAKSWGGVCFAPAKYVIDDYSFWHVPEIPAAMRAWIPNHTPPHTTWAGTGDAETAGTIVRWAYAVRFSDQPNVTARILDINVAAANGGGSAVRVDGIAVWLPAKDQTPCRPFSYP